MEPKDYLEFDFTDIKTPLPIDRRDFLKRMGGGIIIILSLSDFLEVHGDILQGRPMPEDLNVYLRIKEDGRVDCYTGKIEMGQGIITSLAQMLADELDVTLDSVDMIMGDTDLCPWDMGTFGSMSTRFFGPPLRAAGAEARSILLQLAAEELKVAANQLMVDGGEVFERNNKKNSVSYASLTKGKKIVRTVKEKPPLKKPSEFKLIGKSFLKQDSDLKVTGKAKYAGDIRLKDMLYASIVRPPSHDAKVVSVDTSGAEKIQGVVIVNEEDLLAALHTNKHLAEQAAGKIKVKYDVPQAKVNDKNIFEHIVKNAPEGEIAEEGGDVTAGKNNSKQLFEKDYLNSYVAHATIETHTAIAHMTGDKIEIWASTQTPFRAKEAVAELLGLPEDNVRVRQNFVGAGFGGKSTTQQITEAAQLTRITGCPCEV